MAKYDVRVRYAFEGTYTVVAEDHDEARQMVSEDCGLVLGGNIHWKSHSTLTLLATQNYPFWLKYD